MQAMQSWNPCRVGEDFGICNGLESRLDDHKDWILHNFYTLSKSTHGCRTVQKVIDIARKSERERITLSLGPPHVRDLCECKHGNHVISKLVEVFNPDEIGFVLDQIRGYELHIAKNFYGGRTLERLIAHCPDDQVYELCATIVKHAVPLCKHPWANYVLQHLVEHAAKWRSTVVHQLLERMPDFAKHSKASHVVRKCLMFCEPQDFEAIVRKLLEGNPPHTKELACCTGGSHVLAEICDPSNPDSLAPVGARNAVRDSLVPHLRKLDAPLHEHPLEPATQHKHWKCDKCGSHLTPNVRPYRCSQGCASSFCEPCFASWKAGKRVVAAMRRADADAAAAAGGA